MLRLFLLKEAIASVALEHPENHPDCLVCKAAHGNKDAFVSLLLKIQSEERG